MKGNCLFIGNSHNIHIVIFTAMWSHKPLLQFARSLQSQQSKNATCVSVQPLGRGLWQYLIIESEIVHHISPSCWVAMSTLGACCTNPCWLVASFAIQKILVIEPTNHPKYLEKSNVLKTTNYWWFRTVNQHQPQGQIKSQWTHVLKHAMFNNDRKIIGWTSARSRANINNGVNMVNDKRW